MDALPPNPELEILIRKEVNEDLTTRDKCEEIIKKWLLQEPHLPDTLDDVMIINFLRACKFSLEKCKQKLDKYFTVKSTVPEYFSNRTFKQEELLNASNLFDCFPMSRLTDKGYRVSVYRFRTNADLYLPAAVKFCFMVLDLLIKQEQYGNSGHVGIFDGENLTASHLTSVTPTLFKKLLISLFDAYPIRVKEMHVINLHPLANALFNWIKPFLKPKIIHRVHLHNSDKSLNKHKRYQSLYNFVPKKFLPEEYGGDSSSLKDVRDLWIKNLQENEEFFAKLDSLRVDESKRIGKLASHELLFGIEGSFKQLNVD